MYSSQWAENCGETLFGPFWFIGPGSNVDVQDGKAFFGVQHPNYMEAILYAKDLFAAGLIDPEAFSQDQTAYCARGNSDPAIYGLFNAWTGEIEVGSPRIGMETGDMVEYVPLPPIEGTNGEKLWNNMFAGAVANYLQIKTAAENPEVLVRYVDEMYEQDNSIQEVFGMFGKQTEKLDSGWALIPTPADWTSEDWLVDTTTRQLPCIITDEMAANIAGTFNATGDANATKEDNLKYQIASIYAPYAKDEYFPYPAVQFTQEENEEFARLLPVIMGMIMQKEAMWITGASDIEAEYDAFLQELEAMEIDTLTGVCQTALDRWNNN